MDFVGRGHSRNFWLDQENDDRGPWRSRGGGYRGNRRGNNRRGNRGSYYPSLDSRSGSGCSYRSRGRGIPNPRSRSYDDGDEFMGNSDDAPSISGYNPYGISMRGRKKYDNASGSGQKDSNGLTKKAKFGLPVNSRDGSGDSEWYKVMIPWGIRAEKDFILTGIMKLIDVPFVPTDYHFEKQNVIFHVNDAAAANAIRGVSKRITMPSGHKMNIIVKQSCAPNIPMSDEMIEKLKVKKAITDLAATKTGVEKPPLKTIPDTNICAIIDLTGDTNETMAISAVDNNVTVDQEVEKNDGAVEVEVLEELSNKENEETMEEMEQPSTSKETQPPKEDKQNAKIKNECRCSEELLKIQKEILIESKIRNTRLLEISNSLSMMAGTKTPNSLLDMQL